jgi:SsrA-binding protein
MQEKTIATNREALRDYFVVEIVEAGIELKGAEVKSLRESKANLKDSFARAEVGEILLYNLHISPYSFATSEKLDAKRTRRLLLHKRQINKLTQQTSQRGFTLIPLRLYFSAQGLVKIELALCKGKKFYDRREDIKRREAEREMQRAVKSRKR